MATAEEVRKGAEERGRAQRVLKLSPLFERASRATRDAVAACAAVEIIASGGSLATQGAPPEALVVIGRGRARLERVVQGGVVPLGYRGAGEVVGEACLGRVRRYAESAVAMEEAEVLRIPIESLHALLVSDAALTAAALALLVARGRELEDRIEMMLFRKVEGRLADFLLKAADRWGVPVPKGTLISAPITHLEIARSIGSTRETVTLTLLALRKDGVLDVAGRRLIVKDKAALAARG